MFEEIDNRIKESLSEKRYIHSVGVAKRAKFLAKIYGEDEEKAELAGIIHDMAKEMPKEEMLNYAKKNNIEVDEIERIQVGLLHGKIAANIAKCEYGFDDKMCFAIANHTTGNKCMDVFAKIIFLADITEENRNFEDIEHIRSLSEEDLDEACLYVIDWEISRRVKNGELIHPNSIYFRNEMLSLKH